MHFTIAAFDVDGPFLMRTVIWLLANAVDCEALGLWCRTNVRCDRVETFADAEKALSRCERSHPKVLVVDPAVGDDVVDRAATALHARHIQHLLVLDRTPRAGRLAEVLGTPRASYLSRTIAPAALAAALEAMLEHGTQVVDPALAPRLRRTGRGYEFLESRDGATFASLTERERQVMRLLARGKSVRECADELGLAASTIDNHKARLMKKLGIHKASQLTCWAVSEGLIAL